MIEKLFCVWIGSATLQCFLNNNCLFLYLPLSCLLFIFTLYLSASLSLKLLQSALSVHPDKVEKTIDEIMALKKINLDTNPQWVTTVDHMSRPCSFNTESYCVKT